MPIDPWRLRWILWPQLGLVLAVSLVAYTGAFARVGWLRVPGMDKALHFSMFGLLALGVHLHTRGRSVRVGRFGVPLAVVLPLGGASLEELVQALSPHRTADPGDLLADLLGLLVFWRLGVRLTSRPSEPPPATLRAWSTSSASAPPSRTPGPGTSATKSDSPPPPAKC